VGNMERKVVAITGASAGIGRATVREFAKDGCAIGLIARGTRGLEDAKRDVEALGGTAIAIPTDVADADAVEAAAARIESELGPIDIWVNVAFTNVFSQFHELTPEEYQRITNVSYLGFVWGTMAALRRMRERDRGTIVQVGSALCYRSIPLQAAYCGAKSAIRGFTDSLRCELVHHKSRVRVTMVLMPAVNTPQFSWCRSKMPHKPQPVPPIFQPEVAGRAIRWAAHHPGRRELLVGFPTFEAVWGTKLFPGLLDVYLGKTGFASQQYDGGREPGSPDNLMEPVSGDYGAHGSFDDRSRSTSPFTWATEHRYWILGGLAVAAGAIVAVGRSA
jgi:NAD(P)-dependent dehydrogenase (short-subunit alcohol dehydrogenase family)